MKENDLNPDTILAIYFALYLLKQGTDEQSIEKFLVNEGIDADSTTELVKKATTLSEQLTGYVTTKKQSGVNKSQLKEILLYNNGSMIQILALNLKMLGKNRSEIKSFFSAYGLSETDFDKQVDSVVLKDDNDSGSILPDNFKKKEGHTSAILSVLALVVSIVHYLLKSGLFNQ